MNRSKNTRKKSLNKKTEEPWCAKHAQHYADCPCVGPDNAEELGYRLIEKKNGYLAVKIK